MIAYRLQVLGDFLSKNTRIFSSSNEDALTEIAIEKRSARMKRLGLGFLALVLVMAVVIAFVVARTLAEEEQRLIAAERVAAAEKIEAKKRAHAQKHVELISAAFDSYYATSGSCALVLSDLGRLPERDPWGKRYRYEAPNSWRRYLEVRSSGPDGRPYTDDDVLNARRVRYEIVEGVCQHTCNQDESVVHRRAFSASRYPKKQLQRLSLLAMSMSWAHRENNHRPSLEKCDALIVEELAGGDYPYGETIVS